MPRYNFNDVCFEHEPLVSEQLSELFLSIGIGYVFDRTKVKITKSFDDDFGDTVFQIKIQDIDPPFNKLELRVVEFFEGVFGTIQAQFLEPIVDPNSTIME